MKRLPARRSSPSIAARAARPVAPGRARSRLDQAASAELLGTRRIGSGSRSCVGCSTTVSARSTARTNLKAFFEHRSASL